ncbi:MAG: efflux RND transporter permease subunit, partial [Pseudomonadota bacterium]
MTTLMVTASVILMGLAAARLLPLEMFPDVDFPGMEISLPYPSSTPEEVERRIVRPTEEALATMTGVRRMFSNASENGASIVLLFDWDEDMSARAVEARDKVDGIRHLLPDDLERVTVRKFTSTDEPALGLRIGSELDLSDAYELLDRNVRRRLERIEGVARVTLDGVEPRAVRVQLIADRVAAYQIDLNDLGNRLAAANFSISAGFLDDVSAGQRIRVRPVGEFRDLDDVRSLPVNEQGLRLEDIAEVVLESPPRQYERLLEGNFAVGVDIFLESGANLVAVSEQLLEEVEAIRGENEMQGINLYVIFSQAEAVLISLKDLAMAGLIGALMSMIVLYLFLRQWAAT